jgi:hypothetical protein
LEKLGNEERISKTDFKEIGWKGVDRIHMAQHMNRWRAVVNTVLNHQAPQHNRHSSTNLTEFTPMCLKHSEHSYGSIQVFTDRLAHIQLSSEEALCIIQ